MYFADVSLFEPGRLAAQNPKFRIETRVQVSCAADVAGIDGIPDLPRC